MIYHTSRSKKIPMKQQIVRYSKHYFNIFYKSISESTKYQKKSIYQQNENKMHS